MPSVLAVLLPIFALILAGFVCRRSNRLGPGAASEMNRFVVWLCLPALLFRATAISSWEAFWQPGFLAAFAGGCLLIFVATLIWRFAQRRSLSAASVDALSASYANTGYMGIPLCLSVLGEAGLEPALIATLVVVCMLFAIAVICIEAGLQHERALGGALLKVLTALGKNPLVIAPLAGVLWAATGLGVPALVLHFLDLLAAATAPCALVALGLFLAQKQEGEATGVWPLVIVKVVGQPLLTGFLAYRVFQLPALWANAALLLSALPTGTGPFMLAEYYAREAPVVSRTILISTLCSLPTLTACIYWIRSGA
ncbi:AEC family transporter [Azotobacter beijerinckii]|uniref:AEC family transporter n=1 Tax=Azotobacter beijerinckii TaxID=170623 RepID=UPI0029546CE8|nr:AEC family transporter [Azotobacter beijerinckii]MDV7212483.1 AEC family transporter [Azotobacter beijerinckii]